MISSKYIAAAAIVGVCLAAAPALAQHQDNHASRITIAEVDQRLSAQGFRVLDIEWDDNKYEVVAFNSQGQCRELDIQPQTGAVLRDRADDDCHDDDRRSHRR